MQTQRKFRSKGGFSLIEVLVSSFVVALTATVLAVSFPTGDRSRIKANYENTAISIAQRQVEQLRGIGYSSLTGPRLSELGVVSSSTATTEGFPFSTTNSGVLDSSSVSLPQGEAYVRVQQVGIDFKEVLVTVSWQEGSRRRSIKVGTMVANL
jgi:prepilin-type N-terminal cleavage/methylation domain-containing protein